MKAKQGINGHSILEIITSVSIIIILAGLLLSAIGFTRSKAKQSLCTNNQYQLAKALIMYATDSEKLPTSLGKIDDHYFAEAGVGLRGENLVYAAFTADYYQNVKEIKQCPEVNPLEGNVSHNSYGLNLYITNQNLSAITNPSETVLTADSNYEYLESPEQGAKRHFGGMVVSFVDGHVEWLRELPPLSSIITEETPPDPGVPLPPSPFDLNGGTLTLNEDARTHVNILSVPYADQGQSNWFEVYVDILVTLPGGAEFIYNVIGNSAHGITGGMNRSQLEGFSWDSTIFEEGSQVDIMGTSKYWTRTQQTVNGKTKWTWTPQTNSQYSTQNDYGAQVWVLRDGDVIPTVPGAWSQIQLDSQVAPYTEVGPDGLRRMNLADNQVMYFFELGENSPYLDGGQTNSNYNMNDLVILMDINEP